MTGPISVSDYRVRGHLLLYGMVHSYRDAERTTGETWARWERGGCARLDVTVERVTTVDAVHDLIPYAPTSGFNDVSGWLDRIEALHGVDADDLDGGAVYRIDVEGSR